MTKSNQIKSFKDWQDTFDQIKYAVNEYHMKYYLEELEKMTKIDETKQYKFSEIIAMLENKELPVGTKVTMCHTSDLYYYSGEGDVGFWLYDRYGLTPKTGSIFISHEWTIKLPKEDKYYLKAPEVFSRGCVYLNYIKQTKFYFLGIEPFKGNYQSQFTQSEIDAMPFDTSFFGEPIKAEDE